MGQVLPFYLVCDESSSMSGEPVQAINNSLPKLHAEIASNPVVADKTRFALIGFNHHAQVLLALTDLSTVPSVPALNASGGTDYSSAFDLLYDTIVKDIDQLKADGHQVYRPAVFFLSDGQPNDDWTAAYRRVTAPEFAQRPNILAFGFGTADATTIQQVATVKAFMSDGTLGPAEALREFAQSLIRSIVNSGNQSAVSANGGATLVMPDNVPGFTTLNADVV
ncbi:vWA domain-containing protein [Actinomadura rubrisoli]|uniref:VWA domain-containing protein n=1 Tax=Actinomadura rubrisoli TaxID=2530368 RepID=A0A4R5B0E7_9ACTN|nr:VWA domain-containing protein [Actinomadura rubrisoli]TDD78009.1 VWA domain-containing protein [Actinomadura rubrisoli]